MHGGLTSLGGTLSNPKKFLLEGGEYRKPTTVPTYYRPLLKKEEEGCLLSSMVDR